jgi:predicted RNA-binding protein associated with RNAse of E/G family
MEIPRWQPGETVVLRYITRDGKPGMAWPCRLVADRDDLVALYIPRGTTYKAWQNPPAVAERQLVDAEWRRDVLRLMFPNRGYSIWLFWQAEAERRFTTYYVNFEEPFRRTAIGFDTNDHTLDIVVTPELQWSWKDDALFDDRVRQGVYSAEFAAAVRAEAAQVIGAIEARRSPFCDAWEQWLPDSSWAAPYLPVNWNTVPATLWDRRQWAYLSTR